MLLILVNILKLVIILHRILNTNADLPFSDDKGKWIWKHKVCNSLSIKNFIYDTHYLNKKNMLQNLNIYT